jgi:hypothetical protein
MGTGFEVPFPLTGYDPTIQVAPSGAAASVFKFSLTTHFLICYVLGMLSQSDFINGNNQALSFKELNHAS